jgi:hypothetical protein
LADCTGGQVGPVRRPVFSWVGERLITTCKRLVAPEVARAVEVLMQREGVTLEDRLEGLEQETCSGWWERRRGGRGWGSG